MAFDLPAPPPAILTPEDVRRLRPLLLNAIAEVEHANGIDAVILPYDADVDDLASSLAWARALLDRLPRGGVK